MAATQRERINFSKIKEVIDFPNLIEIQKKSYAEFLQLGVDKTKRVEDGLEAVFKEVFPIESYDGSITLDFHVVKVMFLEGERSDEIIQPPAPLFGLLIVTAVPSLLLGLYWNPLVTWVKDSLIFYTQTL